jgi:thiol-disulfide isomerase/thioredoxin
MNYKNCLTGILLLSLKVCGQQIKPLTIGDRVPAIQLKKIFNYTALQSNLAAFDDQLVILDFMGTTCSSCIKILPHFDSIQKSFAGKICIILVSPEKKEKIKKFLVSNSIGKKMKLPIIGEDTLLSKLFPHQYISHEVWIDHGMVKAITDPEYINAENIQTVLSGKTINWLVKNDKQDAQFSSDRYSIIDLYLHSYSLYRLPASHVLLEVKDTGRFVCMGKYKTEWKKKNTFCYDSIAGNNPKKGKEMREDLDRYFNLKGRMENRKVPCFHLIRTTPVTTIISSQQSITLHNLVYSLNQNFYGIPFINDAGEKDIINISDESLTNIGLLKDALKKYGLKLIPGEIETEMLVITQNH